MSGKIYLLTGAAGNLGSNVSRKLIAAGETVRALVLNGDPAIERVPKEAEICSGDVLDVSSLEEFFAVPEDTDIYVIHCASIVALDPDYSQKVHDVNITGTQNILDQCVKHKVKKLVYISSTSAIPELPGDQPIVEVSRFDPDPIIGYYGKSKAEASQLVMDAVNQYDLDASIVFPTGIFGPYDYGFGLITSNIINIVQGKIPVRRGRLLQLRGCARSCRGRDLLLRQGAKGTKAISWATRPSPCRICSTRSRTRAAARE